MKIGAQLYTVRQSCTKLDDFAETLKRVADIGYTTVQVSGTCDYEADWLAEQLKANGLSCNLTHYKLDRIMHEPDDTVAFHNAFGCKYIGLGGMPGNYRGSVANTTQFVTDMLPAARRIKELGSLFMYHNHAFEYERAEDGRTYMQILSDEFAPDEMGFTLDTYWVKYGGAEPVDEIKRLAGRLPCVHFKDMEVLEDGTRRFSWVGGGILNFEEIIAALESAGTQYAFIEQDDCFGADPFDCLRKSYNYLHSLGLN